jgi:Peptidase family S41
MLSRRGFVGAATGAALLPGSAWAQAAAPAALSDIDIIRGALALHPGVNRYLPPAEFARALDSLESAWPTISDTRERFLRLALFLARLQCGHSYPNFFNQRQPIREALFEPIPRLPFTFRWIGGRMVVTGDAGGESGLPRGTVVRSINGHDSRTILRTLLPYARADGGNDAKRRALLEMRGDDGLETFDIYHGLHFGGSASDAIRITARLSDGRRVQRELASATLASRTAGVPGPVSNDGAIWQWDARPDGVAVLTMPSWGLYNNSWNWRVWLDERLSALPRSAKLIVDLRDNEGGQDCGDAILARLIDRDLNLGAYERRVRFRTTPAALNPYLDTWDDSFRTLGATAQDVGGGFYRLPQVDGQGLIPARGPRIDARVAVLTSAANSSATFQFAARCRDTGLARLFGGTTGGNRRGINADKFFFVGLPDSGLEFDLPLVGTFPSTPQPDAGIIPDVAVAPTVADIAAGRDPVMAAALDWLKRG